MCHGEPPAKGYQSATTPKEPHEQLAALMRKEMGAAIDAKMLRLFLRANWRRVSTLAHRIHEEDGCD